MGNPSSKFGLLLHEDAARAKLEDGSLKSIHIADSTVKLTVNNESGYPIIMCWLDFHGAHYHFREIETCACLTETSYIGHVFVFYIINRNPSELTNFRENHPSFRDLKLNYEDRIICAYQITKAVTQDIRISSLSERGNILFSATVTSVVDFEMNDIICLKPCFPLSVVDSTKKCYECTEILGFKVNAEIGVFQKYPMLYDELNRDISYIEKTIPVDAFNIIRLETCIWLNDTMQYGAKRNPITGRGMCVHPGKDWLKANGMNPEKLNGIEIYSAREYLEERKKYPLYLLHEMSHVFHLHCPGGGYENPEIKRVYENAMKLGCYNEVTLRGYDQGKTFKAYACENQMEYFAEISTAFFSEKITEISGNKWSPYTKDALKQIDPEGCNLCEKLWGLTENDYYCREK